MITLGIDALNQVGPAEGLDLIAAGPPVDTSLVGFREALWCFNGSNVVIIGVDGTEYFNINTFADIGGVGGLFGFNANHTQLYVDKLNSVSGLYDVHAYNIFLYPTALSVQYVGVVFTTSGTLPSPPTDDVHELSSFNTNLARWNWMEGYPIGYALANATDAYGSPPSYGPIPGVGLLSVDVTTDANSFVWELHDGVSGDGALAAFSDRFSNGHRYISRLRVTSSFAPRILDYLLIQADDGTTQVLFATKTNLSGDNYDPGSDPDTVAGENTNNYRQSFFDPTKMYILGSHNYGFGSGRQAAVLRNTVPPTKPSTFLFNLVGYYQMFVYKAPQAGGSFCLDDSCLPSTFPGLGRKEGVGQPFQWGPPLP